MNKDKWLARMIVYGVVSAAFLIAAFVLVTDNNRLIGYVLGVGCGYFFGHAQTAWERMRE